MQMCYYITFSFQTVLSGAGVEVSNLLPYVMHCSGVKGTLNICSCYIHFLVISEMGLNGTNNHDFLLGEHCMLRRPRRATLQSVLANSDIMGSNHKAFG